MKVFKPLEECILSRYQYLIDKFEEGDSAQETSMYFVEYCFGCIAMFSKMNPELPLMEVRPSFAKIKNPRPLRSFNEVDHWVAALSNKLHDELKNT